MEEQPITKRGEIDKLREKELEEKAARAFVSGVGQLFGEKTTNSEPYTYKLRENFSYSTNSGHMNEYQKAISNHQQNLNNPFNKMDGVGV